MLHRGNHLHEEDCGWLLESRVGEATAIRFSHFESPLGWNLHCEHFVLILGQCGAVAGLTTSRMLQEQFRPSMA